MKKQKKSDTSVCSQESEDLNLDLKELTVYHELRRGKFRQKMKGLCPTLVSRMAMGGNNIPCINVLDSQKLINTQTNSSKTNSRELKTMEMQQKLSQVSYQTLICSVEDFLAKHSQSLEKGEVSKIPGAHCFLTLQEYLKLKDLKLCSLKTSKAYSITKQGKLLESSFKRFQNWGIIFNGWFLTASFSEFPRTERGYSLSEVLEENPDQKYFLSEKSVKTIMKRVEDKYHPPLLVRIARGEEEVEQPYNSSTIQPIQTIDSTPKKESVQHLTQPKEEIDNQNTR